MMKRGLLIVILMAAAVLSLYGQRRAANPVLLTGVVMDADAQKPLPYVNIQVQGTVYGTASDSNGYFSIFVNPGDTLRFSYIGYRTAYFVMPYNVEGNRYSLIQLLRQESILLSEVVVFPWPTLDQFKNAFLDADVPDDEDARINVVRQQVQQDAEENQLNEYEADQMRYQRLYELNQIFPANNFLNPMRWSNFIRDVSKKKE